MRLGTVAVTVSVTAARNLNFQPRPQLQPQPQAQAQPQTERLRMKTFVWPSTKWVNGIWNHKIIYEGMPARAKGPLALPFSGFAANLFENKGKSFTFCGWIIHINIYELHIRWPPYYIGHVYEFVFICRVRSSLKAQTLWVCLVRVCWFMVRAGCPAIPPGDVTIFVLH